MVVTGSKCEDGVHVGEMALHFFFLAPICQDQGGSLGLDEHPATALTLIEQLFVM